ncbi:MAG: hypothetical protein L0K82_02470 [Pisciglobus halotolerans]|nr:hypothetical protein [Pisciglobus halotolerans]
MPNLVSYFRPFQSSDRQALEDIIRDTWHYDRLGSSRTARLVAKIDLAGSLANQTFTCVAVSDGQPIGVIMGKNRNIQHRSWRYAIREVAAGLQLAFF